MPKCELHATSAISRATDRHNVGTPMPVFRRLRCAVEITDHKQLTYECHALRAREEKDFASSEDRSTPKWGAQVAGGGASGNARRAGYVRLARGLLPPSRGLHVDRAPRLGLALVAELDAESALVRVETRILDGEDQCVLRAIVVV